MSSNNKKPGVSEKNQGSKEYPGLTNSNCELKVSATSMPRPSGHSCTKKRRSESKYWQQRCYNCRIIGHNSNKCIIKKKWWEKQKKDEKTKIPKKTKTPSLKDDGYYIWDYMISPYIDGKKIVSSYSCDWIYGIMDFIGSRDDDGKYYQLILNIEDDSYDDRYLSSVVRLINNPRIMYFILKYFPNILEQKIYIRSSWKDRYSDEALLVQFVTNKNVIKCIMNICLGC